MIKVIYESGKLEGFLKELVEEQSPFALSRLCVRLNTTNDTIRDSMMMGGMRRTNVVYAARSTHQLPYQR